MKGLVIPADVTKPVYVIDLNAGDGSLANLQHEVGGYVDVQAHDVGDIWINDEGRLIDAPVNPRINHWLLNESDWAKRGIVGERQILYGDVVFTGCPDAEGDITAVSDEIVDYFEGLHIGQEAVDDWSIRSTDILVTEWRFGEGDSHVLDEQRVAELEIERRENQGLLDSLAEYDPTGEWTERIEARQVEIDDELVEYHFDEGRDQGMTP